MEQEKLKILTALHDLLSHNVIGSVQYKNRYNGFTAELDFQEWFDAKCEDAPIDSGMFIPTIKSGNPFENAVYFTCSESSPSDFVEIYSSASTLASKGSFLLDTTQQPTILTGKESNFFNRNRMVSLYNSSSIFPPMKFLSSIQRPKNFLFAPSPTFQGCFQRLRIS